MHQRLQQPRLQFGPLQRGDVHERQHDAVRPPGLVAVGVDPQQQRRAAAAFDLAFGVLARFQHAPHMVEQLVVLHLDAVGNLIERAADVVLQQLDDAGHCRRELADAQFPVEEHRADVGAVQQVVHVVVQRESTRRSSTETRR